MLGQFQIKVQTSLTHKSSQYQSDLTASWASRHEPRSELIGKSCCVDRLEFSWILLDQE